MAVLVFAVFGSSVFEVVVICARFGAPAVELEVERRELGAQRLGVGELCLDGLRDADRIAYVRFASVHKQLADTEALRAELSALDLELDGWSPEIGAAESSANHDNFKGRVPEDSKDENGHAPDLNEKETGRSIHA